MKPKQIFAVTKYNFRRWHKNPRIAITFCLAFVLCFLLSDKAVKFAKEYETTIADMKKSAEGNEDFKKKFEELEQRIADEKAAAERKAKEEAEEAEYSNRFKTVVGEQKWRDALTEKAVYAEFKTALQDETNKGKGDKDILAALTQDKEYFAKDPARVPAFSRGTGFAGGEVDDAAVRAAMGLSPKKD